MWKKKLKFRSVAKLFHKKDIGNDMSTSFWYESWSEMGILYDVLGDREIIDLGIKRNATVDEIIKDEPTMVLVSCEKWRDTLIYVDKNRVLKMRTHMFGREAHGFLKKILHSGDMEAIKRR